MSRRPPRVPPNDPNATPNDHAVVDDAECLNQEEWKAAAQQRLSKMAFDYYASGAHDQRTLADNREAWQSLHLAYRVLAGVGERSTQVRVLGQTFRSPVLVGPTAFHGLADPDAELATARAAHRVGTAMSLSTLSNRSIEDIGQAGPFFFQLYVYKDREATRALVQRAQAAGARALLVTVDAPILGTREADVRNRFHLPPHLKVRNLTASGKDALEMSAGSGLAEYVYSLLNPDLRWSDLDWLASITDLPVVVKGVVRGDDAWRATEHGAKAVIVSNHGGRQLDTALPTAMALPEVVEAVDGRAEVLVDGGIRRGTDVIKALALGAKAVLVGRPVLWGLGAQGEAGVEAVLRQLTSEVDLAMALCGASTIEARDRSLVRP